MKKYFLLKYLIGSLVFLSLVTWLNLAANKKRREKIYIEAYQEGYGSAVDTVYKILNRHFKEDTVRGHKRVTALVINDTVVFYLSGKAK